MPKAKRLCAPPFSGPTPEGAATQDAIQKGDIVWLDYDGWVVNPDGTTRLFDTTHADVAKQEGKFEEKKVYAEVPVVVDAGRLFPGFEEALLRARVDERQDVSIPPDKGAGERDPKLVELRPLREFLKQEIAPEVGMEVTISGKRGTITAVTGGRVRVDFNNPLAGRTLKYSFTVTKRATTVEEKVRGILDMDYSLGDQFRVTIHDEEAEIVVPDICKTDERWFVSKFRAVADLREFSGLRKIRFVEEYEKKEAPKLPAKAVEAAPAQAKKETTAPVATPPAKRRRRKAPPEPPREKTPEEL